MKQLLPGEEQLVEVAPCDWWSRDLEDAKSFIEMHYPKGNTAGWGSFADFISMRPTLEEVLRAIHRCPGNFQLRFGTPAPCENGRNSLYEVKYLVTNVDIEMNRISKTQEPRTAVILLLEDCPHSLILEVSL